MHLFIYTYDIRQCITYVCNLCVWGQFMCVMQSTCMYMSLCYTVTGSESAKFVCIVYMYSCTQVWAQIERLDPESMYVHLHVYIYIYIRAFTCIYTCVCMYSYTCMNTTWALACKVLSISMYMSAYVLIHIRVSTGPEHRPGKCPSTCTYVRMYSYTHVWIQVQSMCQVYTCTYMRVFICTHTYTYEYRSRALARKVPSTHMYMYICAYVLIHIRMSPGAEHWLGKCQVHICTCTYVRMYSYIYVWVQVQSIGSESAKSLASHQQTSDQRVKTMEEQHKQNTAQLQAKLDDAAKKHAAVHCLCTRLCVCVCMYVCVCFTPPKLFFPRVFFPLRKNISPSKIQQCESTNIVLCKAGVGSRLYVTACEITCVMWCAWPACARIVSRIYDDHNWQLWIMRYIYIYIYIHTYIHAGFQGCRWASCQGSQDSGGEGQLLNRTHYVP